MTKLQELQLQLLPHTFYLPTLAPSTYVSQDAAKQFANNERVQFLVDGYLQQFDDTHNDTREGIGKRENIYQAGKRLYRDINFLYRFSFAISL